MSETPVTGPEWDNFDRALLASAELDTPASGALARARRALGAATLGSAVLVSASTSLGASAGATGATLAGVSLVALGKALLVGAAVGVGFVGMVNGGFSAPAEAPRAARPAKSASLVADARVPGRSNLAVALPATEPALAAAQPAEEAPVANAGSVREVAPRERSSSLGRPLPSAQSAVTSLSVEVELLDQARAALVRKEPAAALSALDHYAQLSLGRSLGREASLLRIEALRDLGRAASAGELAKRLADEDPNGLTGQRAQELIR